MLLPPDMRDWVPQDDMVHFVVAAVEQMDLSMAEVNLRGAGSEQYSPSMMTALLIYCYAHGIFSSRKIERATYRDVAVRYLSGDTHPDHDTIARQSNGRTSFWDHQRSARVPPFPPARTSQSGNRIAPGVPRLQLQSI